MYNKIEDIPCEYQDLINRLIKNGIISIKTGGRIKISEDMLEMILILSRLGLLP